MNVLYKRYIMNVVEKIQKISHQLVNTVIRFFGLKGSWSWAIREMKKGKVVTQKCVTGTLKYRLSEDGQDRLLWDFSEKESYVAWENANFFISKVIATD